MKSKKASRILTLALAAAIALVPVTMVSAATTTTITNIEGTIGDTTVAFVVSYTMDGTANDQVTTLVTKGSAEITYDANNQPTNIVYIDQVGYSATTSVFNFVVDKPAENATYYVKVGGSGINSPASSSKLIEVTSTGAFTISGIVSSAADAIDAGDPDINAELNTAWQTVVNLKPSFNSDPIATKIVDASTKEFRFDLVQNGNYVLEIKRAGFLTRYVSVTVNNGNVNVGDKAILPGDLNEDYIIDGSDTGILFSVLGKAYGETGYNTIYDIYGDGSIDGSDTGAVFPHLGKDISIYNEEVDFDN